MVHWRTASVRCLLTDEDIHYKSWHENDNTTDYISDLTGRGLLGDNLLTSICDAHSVNCFTIFISHEKKLGVTSYTRCNNFNENKEGKHLFFILVSDGSVYKPVRMEREVGHQYIFDQEEPFIAFPSHHLVLWCGGQEEEGGGCNRRSQRVT